MPIHITMEYEGLLVLSGLSLRQPHGTTDTSQHITDYPMEADSLPKPSFSLFTRTEAADYLGVSASAVKVYITQNRLPAFKKGKTWLFQEQDLKTFKESEWFQTRKPGAPRKYSDDIPKLHLFVGESRRKTKVKDDAGAS